MTFLGTPKFQETLLKIQSLRNACFKHVKVCNSTNGLDYHDQVFKLFQLSKSFTFEEDLTEPAVGVIRVIHECPWDNCEWTKTYEIHHVLSPIEVKEVKE